jgi:TPR repeat protein
VRATHLVAVALAAFVLALLVPARAEPRKRLSDECTQASNPESCRAVGDLLERDAAARRYPEEPGLYYALGCEEGDVRSCRSAQPWARRYSDYEALETDVGCMLKDNGFACEEVSNTLRRETDDEGQGAGVLVLARSRMRRALTLYLQACARGEAEGCLGASRVYWAGFGVPWSPREGRAKEEEACALGLRAACEQEGDHRTGAAAVPLYRKACDLAPPSPHACLKLARAYEAAGGDRAAVDASYRRACELLSFDACLWVSQRVDDLRGESPAVVAAFRRWCEAGSPRGCALSNRTPGAVPVKAPGATP